MRGSTSRQTKNKHWSLNWNLKSSTIGKFLARKLRVCEKVHKSDPNHDN